MDYADKQAYAMGEGLNAETAGCYARNSTPLSKFRKPRKRKMPTKQSIGAACFGPV